MNRTLTEPGAFAVGVNYWASHAGTAMWTDWRPEVIEEDFAQLSANGLTTIRVFPLWPVFQPLCWTYGGNGVPHDLRFGEHALPETVAGRAGVSEEALDRFECLADCAEDHGIELIVGLVTGWMSGRLFVPPAFEGRNVLTDPLVRRWTLRFIRCFVAAMRDKPAIRYWDLGNECNCMAPVESSDRAYEWTAAVAGAIRLEDPSRAIVSGMHSLDAGSRGHWRIIDQGELTDVLTTHPYPIFTPHCNLEPVNTIRNAFHATAESRLYSDVGGRPCFAEELGTLGPEVASEQVASKYLRNALWNLWAHDCRGMLWWCAYDQDLLRHAPYDWNGHERELGLFRHDRRVKPMAVSVTQFMDTIGGTGVAPLSPLRIDAICILTEGQDQWGAAFSAFILAKQAGFDLRYQTADQPLGNAELYLLPSVSGARAIGARLHEELIERVRAGATLYLSWDGSYLGWFEQTFGMRVRSRFATSEALHTVVDGAELQVSRSACLELEAAGADILAIDGAGLPAFCRNRLENGEVYLFAAPLERHLAETPNAFLEDKSGGGLRSVYRAVSARARAERAVEWSDHTVTVTEHDAGNGRRVLVLVNNGPEDRRAVLRLRAGWALERRAVGEGRTSVTVSLPGNDGAVLIVRR